MGCPNISYVNVFGACLFLKGYCLVGGEDGGDTSPSLLAVSSSASSMSSLGSAVTVTSFSSPVPLYSSCSLSVSDVHRVCSPITSSPSGAGVAGRSWNAVASGLRLLLVCAAESPWGHPDMHHQSSSSESDEDLSSAFCVVGVFFSFVCFLTSFLFRLV